MWNHNTHFHPYLLRQLPKQIERGLDVGCGLGYFSKKLAERAAVVDAIDVDSTVIAEAIRSQAAPNIDYIQANFQEVDLPSNAYDAIVAIASLHHLDLTTALQKMQALLRSSGTLLILGLYRETTIADWCYGAMSVPLNWLYLSWYPLSIAPVTAPTRPAQLSLNQIKTIANTWLPGFVLRRHLFWRYSLVWRKLG